MSDFSLEYTSDGGLEAFAARLEALGTGREAFHKACADAVKPLVEAEFAQGADPFGMSWTSTVRGNDPLIGATRMLSTSVQSVPTADGFDIIIGDWKAIFHQYGTRRGIPPRPMLPDGKMPPAWRDAMKQAFTTWLQDSLAG